MGTVLSDSTPADIAELSSASQAQLEQCNAASAVAISSGLQTLSEISAEQPASEMASTNNVSSAGFCFVML